MSVTIRWARDRWFLLGAALLAVNVWAAIRFVDRPINEEPAPRVVEKPCPVCARAEAAPAAPVPLALESVNQVEYRPGQSCTLRLAFNQAPRRTDLEEFIVLRRRMDGKAVPFDILGHLGAKVVLLRTRRALTDQLRLVLRRGLSSADGNVALAREVRRSVNCTPDFVLRRVEPRIPRPGNASVRLYFSGPVDMQGIERLISVTPPVELSFEHVSGWRESGVAAAGALEPGTSYTFTLDETLASTTGQSLGRTMTRQVYMPDLPPWFRLHGSGHYLSAAGRRQVRLSAVNVETIDVRAERVHPNNLVYFAMRRAGNYRSYGRWNRDRAHERLSELVGEQRIEVRAPPNEVREFHLDMDRLVDGDLTGAFVLNVIPDKGAGQRRLIVLTDLGISVRKSPRGLLVWANSIHAAQPLKDVDIEVYSEANQRMHRGRTDADGLVRFADEAAAADGTPYLVTARHGHDLSYLPLQEHRVTLPGDTGGRTPPRGDVEAYLYTDRGIYRPGETVHLRAVVRNRQLDCPEPFPVEIRVQAPDGRVSRTLVGMLGVLGTEVFEWTWADHVPTGAHRAKLFIPGSDTPLGSVGVAVEEFVPPRITTSIVEGPERLALADGLRFDVVARYLAGRPASGRPVEGRAHLQAARFAPAGWEGYVFHDDGKNFAPVDLKLGIGALDDDGRAVFRRTLDARWSPPSAIAATLTASVRDVGGRTTSAHAEQVIDAYPFYVGLRASVEGGHVPIGDPLEVQVVAVKPDGSIAADGRSLQARVERISWATVLKKNAEGSYGYHSEKRLLPVDERNLTVVDGRAVYAFVPEAPGRYRVSVSDPDSRSSSSVIVQAAAPDAVWVDWSMERPDRVGLELDREGYRPGEPARLAVHAPFAGRCLLTVETDRVLETRVLDLPAGRSEVTLHPDRAWLPNVYCAVSLLRPLQVGEEVSPHRAVGIIPVVVHEPERRLAVSLEAPDVSRPAERLQVRVQTKGNEGDPVEAEVVIAAVDEGICRLTGFETPDPLSLFRGRRAFASTHFDLYSVLMPEWGDPVNGTPSATGGGGGSSSRGRRLNPVRARRFRPVALWSGPVLTDSRGTASVSFDVPEFTGSLRIMAVAVAPRRFGHAGAEVLVKRPIQTFADLPRFLAPGDTSRMGLTFVNEAGAARTIQWTLRSNRMLSADPTEGEVTLDPGREQTISVALQAGTNAGVAKLAWAVASGDEVFKEATELSIRPPSARQVRAGVVTVPPGAAREVRPPTAWIEGTAAYRFTYAGIPELNLGRSLDYLLRYPYGCLEQTTSSAFPLLYLSDLAEATQPGSIAMEDTEGYVQQGVLRLLSMQQPQGGFGYWPRTRDVYPWGSLYATHFLVEAGQAGHDVPGGRLDAALGYVEKLLKGNAPERDKDDFRSDRLRRAYACHVLALAGRPHHGWMGRLIEEAPDLSSAATACLGSALAVSERRAEALGILGPVAREMDPDPSREIAGCLSSPVRDLALLLSAWARVDPTGDQAATLARRLQELEAGERWTTTQEHAVAAMALGKYARETAARRLPFEGEVTWNEGREKHPVSGNEPWNSASAEMGDGPVSVVNYGPGDAYFYWHAEGVPLRGLPPDVDHQVRIRRAVLDREGNPLPDGSLNQGDLVVVKLTVDTLGRGLDQLVIEDLLPAGLEPEHVGLKTSESVPWLRRHAQGPLRHVEARDDRTLFFTGAFSGSKDFYHVVRAVTPGQYTWPPASVSCMYAPGIRSVHGAGSLEVVDE